MPECKPAIKTPIDEASSMGALVWVWKEKFGALPLLGAVAICYAQMTLETGRFKSCWNHNVGNIKKGRNPDDGRDWCMFRCSEILNGKEVWFDPPHVQTHFRAYEDIHDGMRDYLDFLSNRKRYAKAWAKLMEGDVNAFGHELKVAGYYTANEEKYTKGLRLLVNEFAKKFTAILDAEAQREEATNQRMREQTLALLNTTLTASAWESLENDMHDSLTPNWDESEGS